MYFKVLRDSHCDAEGVSLAMSLRRPGGKKEMAF